MPKNSLTPARQKQILFGVLGLIGLVGWVSFFLLPQQRLMGQERMQLQELQSQVEQTRRGLAQMPVMEEQIRQLTARYQLPAVTKPPEQQLPDLLEMISQTARRAQVRVIAAKPSSDVSKLVPGPSGYLELQILLALSGGYHQTGTFLDTLERSGNLLRVRELALLPNPENLYHHQVVILFQAYLVPAHLKEKGA